MNERERTRLATVQVIENEEAGNTGQGFIVHGGYILTAAHCVPWSGQGQMPLRFGYYFLVNMITADGQRLTGQVVAVEPVSDIAVIASPDNQTFPKEAEAFDLFAQSVNPLPLSSKEFPFGQPFQIHILTHTGDWLSGEASQWAENAPTLVTETDPAIEGGTSGSAVLSDTGEVLAVVSTVGNSGDGSAGIGSNARPCQSLPVWVWRGIKAAERETQELSEAAGNGPATAPDADLLAVCKAMLAACNCNYDPQTILSEYGDQARAAIARAENQRGGEPT